ncbi:MAG: hypothetical protein GY778_13415 [bacterium]|nr:hypothetical protein [bacterium]
MLDFAYGTIGHLRLMAERGADVVGVEIDPLWRAMYSVSSVQGMVQTGSGSTGRVHDRFPHIADEVAGRYDLITSKNTLKNGYLQRERPVLPERLLDLGVSDAEIGALRAAGGVRLA